MKKKPKANKQAKLSELGSLQRQRTRVVGEMTLLPDTSEAYMLLDKKRLCLNDEIEAIERKLK